MPNNTIVLIGDQAEYHREPRAAAALKPGHLLEYTTGGTVQKHSAAGGKVAPILVAKEDSLCGGNIDGGLPIPDGAGNTTYYVTGGVVRVHVCQPGDVIQFLMADNEVAVVGSKMTSNGDGTVQVWSNETADTAIIGTAEEALDLTSNGSAEFIKVTIR